MGVSSSSRRAASWAASDEDPDLTMPLEREQPSFHEAKLGATRKHFTQAVSSGQYGFLRQSGGFMLWKRGAPQDKNAAGLKLIGPEPPPARRKK